MSAVNTKETKELVVFIIRTFKDVMAKYKDDGKLSKGDIFGVVWNHFGEGIAAFTGISGVPKEISAISANDLMALRAVIEQELALAEGDHAKEIFDTVWNLIVAGINSWSTLEKILYPPAASVTAPEGSAPLPPS